MADVVNVGCDSPPPRAGVSFRYLWYNHATLDTVELMPGLVHFGTNSDHEILYGLEWALGVNINRQVAGEIGNTFGNGGDACS